MSILFADFPGGDTPIYGTDDDLLLDGVYAQAGNNLGGAVAIRIVDDPDPSVTDGLACRFTLPNGGGSTAVWAYLRFVLPIARATVGFAERLYVAGLPTSDTRGYTTAFRDANNSNHVYWYVMTTGQIKAIGPIGELGRTANPVISANAWHHIETKLVISDSVGSIEIRVDGVVKLHVTGADTKGTAETTVAQIARYVRQNDGAGGGYTYSKDNVYWNDQGSYNNDFLGSVQVLKLALDADVSFNWAPSTGSTGWDLLGDTPPEDTVDYIEANDDPPAASEFSFADLPEDITSVRALISIGRQFKSDGGDGQTQTAFASGGDSVLGTDRALTVAPTWYWDVSEVDPDTAAPWIPAAVDLATVLIDRTV